MNKTALLISILAIILLTSSCKSQKEIAYFQNIDIEKVNSENKAIQQYESVILSGDLLSIIVSSLDPLSSAPFNLPIVSYSSPNSDQLYSQPMLQTYLVDKNGNIEFPIVGKIKLGGLTKTEAISLIKEMLIPYLKTPIINLKISNYKISVLGEVTRPGAYNIPNEKVTLLEALAMAGDLTIYGKRTNVLIFRETQDGGKTMAKIDLTSTELFNSPYYYLQQNDIIYVEPNKTKASTSTYNPNIPIIISAISTAISLLTVLLFYK